jgi:hypothetical protein
MIRSSNPKDMQPCWRSSPFSLNTAKGNRGYSIMSRSNRRTFLRQAAAATSALAGLGLSAGTIGQAAPQIATAGATPWYRRTLRWGQTNITEIDPAGYDINWWRQHWKRTRVQGVILNAGGIVAYYPSKYPLHYRPPQLGDRDLYGELAKAAHEDGLAVFARMDSNRTHEAFYKAHPDWFARDAAGKPYRAGELYVTCVNSPYYDEYIPGILAEIIERTRPEGITDNSWSGLGRDSICHCDNCAKKFQERAGKKIPREKNWDDPVYRDWIEWNYVRRLEIWDLNNRATKVAGGPDCLWVGMNSGSINAQCRSFRNLKEICRRAEILMLDHQARSEGGFQQNGETGKFMHGLLGWNKLAPESTAMYQAGQPTFRKASKPEPEVRLWMLEGFAGTIQPWWHHIGAYQEDRRQYRTVEPMNRWHEANQEYLVGREPIASVGLVWSQTNTDYYGRDNPEELVELPFRGMANALLRGRIPYLPVHADHIERDRPRLSVLVLPNLAVMSPSQCAAVRRFVERGGNLIATGQTSLYDPFGEPRNDFALADLFGAHVRSAQDNSTRPERRRAGEALHSYLRLAPDLRAGVYGPKIGNEPPPSRKRHPILKGFDETDILPFGGSLGSVRAEAGAAVLATFVPPFPVYPPESSWMRVPRTDIPALILPVARKGRVAYMPADLDRRYARDNLPDHGNLLANLVRWAAGDTIPLAVHGPGLIDCHFYRQSNRLVLHLVNLTNTGRGPVDELIPVGPLRIEVRTIEGLPVSKMRSLVSQAESELTLENGWAACQIRSLVDHEVLVLE